MGFIIRAFTFLINVLLLPFRLIGRVFGGRAATTARKAIGGVAATDAVAQATADEMPQVVTSFPFRALDRPRLAEQSASELTLDVAESFVARAHRFYGYQFDLFPRSGLFYEEVELQEVSHALASDDPNSTDARFVVWMNLFRRTLNDNARRLLMIYVPLVVVVTLMLGIFIVRQMPEVVSIPWVGSGQLPASYLVFPAMSIVGLLFLILLYQWPFKVVIQRNLLGLDNYITSRFSRINQNFQVAKRFALNVERNKRMSQAEELKYEAGVWTVAYNWFAMRLYLCERVVRNQMYQVSRNATLYSLGGIVLSLTLAAVLLGVWIAAFPADLHPRQTYLAFAATAIGYIIVIYSMVVGGTAGEASKVLSDNEWFRFGAAELDRTIADHVGEDKLQIVTFRDRNRIE